MCARLASVAIGNSVSNIAECAFLQCTELASVTIPDSVRTIGRAAFCNSDNMTNVTLGSGVTNVGDYAFGCTGLTAITVNPSNLVYSSVDGVLFNRDQTTLIQCPAAKAGSYSIPNGTCAIGGNAIASCANLTSVAIPDSVTNIGDFAFYGCSGQTGVTIPKSITSIGQEAFSRCTGLTTIAVSAGNPAYSSADGVLFNVAQSTLITYPAGRTGGYAVSDTVTNIGNAAFLGCSNLTSVTIPGSVTSIAGFAFVECSNLEAAYFLGDAPLFAHTGGTPVFWGDARATVFYLPNTTGWGSAFVSAVLWNPQIQTTAASFGLGTNGFGFTITGTANIPIVIEACTNLANPIWSPVRTSTLTGGSSYFRDPQWTNYPTRFYRIRWP